MIQGNLGQLEAQHAKGRPNESVVFGVLLVATGLCVLLAIDGVRSSCSSCSGSSPLLPLLGLAAYLLIVTARHMNVPMRTIAIAVGVLCGGHLVFVVEMFSRGQFCTLCIAIAACGFTLCGMFLQAKVLTWLATLAGIVVGALTIQVGVGSVAKGGFGLLQRPLELWQEHDHSANNASLGRVAVSVHVLEPNKCDSCISIRENVLEPLKREFGDSIEIHYSKAPHVEGLPTITLNLPTGKEFSPVVPILHSKLRLAIMELLRRSRTGVARVST